MTELNRTEPRITDVTAWYTFLFIRIMNFQTLNFVDMSIYIYTYTWHGLKIYTIFYYYFIECIVYLCLCHLLVLVLFETVYTVFFYPQNLIISYNNRFSSSSVHYNYTMLKGLVMSHGFHLFLLFFFVCAFYVGMRCFIWTCAKERTMAGNLSEIFTLKLLLLAFLLLFSFGRVSNLRYSFHWSSGILLHCVLLKPLPKCVSYYILTAIRIQYTYIFFFCLMFLFFCITAKFQLIHSWWSTRSNDRIPCHV